MTQIDFYLLQANHSATPSSPGSENSGLESQLPFACRLIEKIYRMDKKIYIHSSSEAESGQISKSLWYQRKESFLAHDIINNNGESTGSPIEIGSRENTHNYDVMINLADEVPSFVGRFDRVVELVSDNQQIKAKARQRYTYYRERGYPIKTHDLAKSR